MSQTFTGTLSVDVSAAVVDTGTVTTVRDQIASGTTAFPSMAHTLTNGTGANQARRQWYQRRTLAAAGNDDIDLQNLTDRWGAVLVFTKLKWLALRLSTPATGIFLNVGGNGPANPFTAMFADPTDRLMVYDLLVNVNQVDGWTVDATHKVLRINNPGAGPVTYDLVLIGF